MVLKPWLTKEAIAAGTLPCDMGYAQFKQQLCALTYKHRFCKKLYRNVRGKIDRDELELHWLLDITWSTRSFTEETQLPGFEEDGCPPCDADNLVYMEELDERIETRKALAQIAKPF